jgi:hypothetical protein
VLHADLNGPTYTYNSNGRLILESKDDMKKRGLRSPDAGDSLALTFAVPVAPREMSKSDRYKRFGARRRPVAHSWMSI